MNSPALLKTHSLIFNYWKMETEKKVLVIVLMVISFILGLMIYANGQQKKARLLGPNTYIEEYQTTFKIVTTNKAIYDAIIKKYDWQWLSQSRALIQPPKLGLYSYTIYFKTIYLYQIESLAKSL